MNELPTDKFNRLYKEHYEALKHWFLKDFSSHTAEDLCQQTFLNVWKYIGFSGKESPRKEKAWLFAIAKNVKNDYFRTSLSKPQNFNYLDLSGLSVPDGGNSEDSMLLSFAFSQLSKEEKELLTMADYLKSREIASVLGISASAVRSRIAKAKEHLKELV